MGINQILPLDQLFDLGNSPNLPRHQAPPFIFIFLGIFLGGHTWQRPKASPDSLFQGDSWQYWREGKLTGGGGGMRCIVCKAGALSLRPSAPSFFKKSKPLEHLHSFTENSTRQSTCNTARQVANTQFIAIFSCVPFPIYSVEENQEPKRQSGTFRRGWNQSLGYCVSAFAP